MAGNPANHGYLCGIILKEISAGRACEITGSMFANIKTHEDYLDRKYRLMGKFGEVIHRNLQTGATVIATRDVPEWAARKIHEVIWDCDEMLRWRAEEDLR